MTQLQAKRLAAKTTAPRFGLLSEWGAGVWIFECRTIPANKNFGRIGHQKRFRGCVVNSFNEQGSKFHKSVYKGKGYKGLWLEVELTRTDRITSIVSERVLETILLNSNT